MRVVGDGESQEPAEEVEAWVSDIFARIPKPAKSETGGKPSKRTPERAVA